MLYIEGGFFFGVITKVRIKKFFAFSPTATVRVFTYTSQVENTYKF